MAPIIDTTDPRAVKILDAAGIPYKLIEQPRAQPTVVSPEISPADYLLLEARDAGNDSYPDLWVCKYRLGVSPAVVAVRGIVGAALEDTATEKNGRKYIGNINQGTALRLNLSLGGRTPNLTILRDFSKLLDSGRAFDGNGKKARKSELSQILGEIFEVREPWRAEWLEDSFREAQAGLVLNKNYRLENGVLKLGYSELVQECLMEDRTPAGISFKDWIIHATSQGLPLKNIKSGSFYSWAPRAGCVARFVAYSDRAYLDCDWDPDVTFSSLRVRHVREAPKK